MHNNLSSICNARFWVNIPQMACLRRILMRPGAWNDHVKWSFPFVTEQILNMLQWAVGLPGPLVKA